MSLDNSAHVEAWFLLRRFMDNQSGHAVHEAAAEWLRDYLPSIDVYRDALAQGAKPLDFRLTPTQASLLARMSVGPVRVRWEELGPMRALVARYLATELSSHQGTITSWGREWLRLHDPKPEGRRCCMKRIDRAQRVAEAVMLSRRGMNGSQIAASLGVSRSYAYELLKDPDGNEALKRKARNDG